MVQRWSCKSKKCSGKWPQKPDGNKCTKCGSGVKLVKNFQDRSRGRNAALSNSATSPSTGNLSAASGVQAPMFNPNLRFLHGIQTPGFPPSVFNPNLRLLHGHGQWNGYVSVSSNHIPLPPPPPPPPPFHQQMAVPQGPAGVVYVPNLGWVKPVSHAHSMQMVPYQYLYDQVPQQWNPAPFVPGRMSVYPAHGSIPGFSRNLGYGSMDPSRSQTFPLQNPAHPDSSASAKTKKKDVSQITPEVLLNTEAGSLGDGSGGTKPEKDSMKESSKAFDHGDQELWCFTHHENHKYNPGCGSTKHSYRVKSSASMGWKQATGHHWDTILGESVINPVNMRQFMTILEIHWERTVPRYKAHCQKRDRRFLTICDPLLWSHVRGEHLQALTAFFSRMCNITKLAVFEWRRHTFSLANKYVVDVLIPDLLPLFEGRNDSRVRQGRHSRVKSAYIKLMEEMDMVDSTASPIPNLDGMAMNHFKVLMSCLKQRIQFGHNNVMEDARRYLLSNTDLLDRSEVKDAFKAIFTLNIKFEDPNEFGISEIKWPDFV